MKHTDFQPYILIFWRKSCWLRLLYFFFQKQLFNYKTCKFSAHSGNHWKSATEIEKQCIVISAKRGQSQMSHLIAWHFFFQTRKALFCVNKAMSCQVILPPLCWLSCLVHFFHAVTQLFMGKCITPKFPVFIRITKVFIW